MPAAAPFLLILIASWITLSRAGFDVVEPDVLGACSVGPRLFACDGACVAADAFVEVHHHPDLSHHPHQYVTSWLRLRIVDTMSRWFPAGPR
ncbi:Uncharacterised protein [Mycobacteroides abscessus subsp. abscessus]|nr:Uncharacterised protein [Mycobacteroides abscessus subsp. abscessus]